MYAPRPMEEPFAQMNILSGPDFQTMKASLWDHSVDSYDTLSSVLFQSDHSEMGGLMLCIIGIQCRDFLKEEYIVQGLLEGCDLGVAGATDWVEVVYSTKSKTGTAKIYSR